MDKKKITLKGELGSSDSIVELISNMKKYNLINGDYEMERMNQLKDGQFTMFFKKKPVSDTELMIRALKDYKLPKIKPIKKHVTNGTELLVHLSLFYDVHLGLLTWKAECGTNWDVKISSKCVIDYIDKITSYYGSLGRPIRFLITTGNDFFHIEDDKAETPRSRHKVEKDGRYMKMYRTGIDIYYYAIESFRRIGKVDVVYIEDNHAPLTSAVLTEHIYSTYKGDPNITVDRSLEPMKFYKYGKVLLVLYHGHITNKNLLNAKIMKKCPWDISQFTTIECIQGHLHHFKIEKLMVNDGQDHITLIYMPTIIPKEGYANLAGYNSTRESIALEYNKKTRINTHKL